MRRCNCHVYEVVHTTPYLCLHHYIPRTHHRNRWSSTSEVSFDSDMMAVGVWYLSSLMTLAFAYAVLNIFYFFNHEFLYTQQGQVLDLCLRITIGPIFFLPAPAFLLRFYREHFRKFKGGSSNGRNASGGRNWGSGNNHFNGSFTNSEHHHTTMSPDTTRIGSRIGGSDSIPRGSFDISSDRYQEPTSPGGTYGRLKMFHARDRGHSVESSRVLNRDFECESSHSQHPSEDRADSFHQYFSSMDGSKHPLRQSVALDDFESLEQKNSKPYDPLQSKEWPYNVDTPQQPQPALIEQRIRGIRNETVAGLADLELPVKSLARLATHANNTTGEMAVAQVEDNSKPKRRDISPNEKIALGRITGTTGWEVGGFNAQATSVSSAAEDKPTSERPVTKNETSTHDTPIAADDSLEGLTGLQRQLAEHRSALLPQVIAYKAYKEDLAFVEPFDHTFKPSPFPLYEPERPHQSISDVLPSTINSNPWSQDGAAPDASKFGRGGHEPESKSPIHVVEPGHWSTTSSKNRAEGDLAYNSNASNAHAGSSRSRDKSKEGIIAAFSKAIVGGGHGGNIGHTKGSSTKEGNSISHPRSSQDANDRGFKIINSGHIDRPLETSQNPTPATVEELAELSVRVREGEVTRTSSPYDYSDPYDVRTGFSSSHAAGAHASAMTKSPSASMASKGASTPSLGSFKSRESLSKSSTASREPQIRPTSPSPPSKKSSSKSTSRTARSKSDATYREGSESPRTPMSELPITASRLMSAAASSEIPSVPPAMVKTSLSPPPRQSWRRSKSFKGSNSPITAIDTSVTTETEQQSGDPLSSINFTNPSTTHSSPIGNVSSSTGFPDSCSFSSISQSHGHHASSLEDSTDCRPSQERERVAPLSPPLSGLSSRLQGTRHQRSVDNLTSAYFYKRASELNGNNTATSSSPYPVRDSHGIAVPSSLHSSTRSPTLGSPPSPSPNTYMFSYSHDNHSRKSPSPTRYGGFSPSSSPSPSATMTMANTQLGLSFGATDLTPPESRSSSFANSSGPHHPQSRMLADDPWTQAMVNRAQAQTNSSSAAGKSSGKHDRSMSPVYVMDPNARPSIARATSE
ncbi:hypothetical protein BC939DRAFT_128497 [Gamsiella multidivaricata]|uniref:uncharacterized protein n=1 Tax=Gamsiella multidivaricata TaxID=101098 RepID=UPI002220D6EC|nr:uncharacterized protein BC939DRAFT_128497 [Gamsiella multidivaricata]KAI7825358.1 hypothetical protein BC939DRAFT_128497 [Gamsiella multidivaricata]